MTSQEVTSLSERVTSQEEGGVDDVIGGDVTRRGNDVTGEEEENDVTVDNITEMTLRWTKMSWVREIT